MADDDRIVRLVFTLDGGRQFSADVKGSVAAAVTGAAAIEGAQVNLTNVTVREIKKRSDAQTQGAAATNQATQAQLAAANAAATAFAPATERVITSISRQTQALDSLRRRYDPLSAAVISAQRDIDKATAIIERNGAASKDGAEAVGLLVVATQRLKEAQAAKSITSADALGGMSVVVDQYNQALNAAQQYARQGLDRVISKHDAVTASARTLVGELASVDNAFKNGLITHEKYIELNSKIIESYDLGAIAARNFAEQQAKLNATVNAIRNPVTPGQGTEFQQGSRTAQPNVGNDPRFFTGNQARAAAVAPQDLLAGAKESAAQIAEDTQKYYNNILGVHDQIGLLAKDSVAFFEEVSATEKQAATDAQRLRDQIDPISAAFGKYGSAVAEADKLVASGNLTITDRDKIVKLAQYTFESATESIRKNALDTYNALKTASDNFQKTQMIGRTGPIVPTSEITAATNISTQIQRNVVSGEPLDPKQIQNAKELTAALETMTRAENDAAVAAQKLKDELEPVGAIQRNLSQTIDEYQSHLDKGRITLDEFTAAQKKATDAANVKISDASGLTAAQADYDKLTKAADGYKASLNPLIAVQKQYAERIAEVNELVSVNALTQKQADAVLGDFVQKEAAASAALAKANAENLNAQQIQKNFKPILQQAGKDFTDFSSTTTRAFGLNRVGFLELQAAGINAFQSLAAGISPLRTAETEGAQVVGALIQGTNLTLKQLISYAAPLAGVAAAFVAFGVAIASAAARATQIRELNVSLATFHQGTDVTAADLVKIQKEFAKTGESTTALQTALAGLARNPNINISATSNILGVARDIGAAFGTDITGGLDKLTTALNGGAEGIVALGHELGILKDGQGGEILILEKTAGQQAAVKRGYELIAAGLKPYTESLGPAQELTRAITGVWNQFIDSIKESGPVQNALTYLQDLTTKLTNLKNELKTQNETGKGTEATSVFSGVLHGATIGALAGAGVGAAAVSPGIITIPLGAAAGGAVGAVTGGIAGGLGAYGLNSIGPIGRQGTIPNTPNISAMEALNPLSMFTSNPSVNAPTVASYSTALVTDTSGRTGVSSTLAGTDRSIVSLGTGLRNTNDTLSRFNTTISTSTSVEERNIQTETNNYNNEVKGLDAVAVAFDKVKNAADPLATTLANIKAPPQMVGGMETGGAVGGGAVGGGATVSSTGAITFGNPFINALAQLETSGRNISQQIVDSNTAKGTPGEGIFQITRPTAAQFSQGRFSSAFQLDAGGQAALAENIPLNRFGERTQRGMQEQFGPLDTSKTIGQLAQLTTGTQNYTTAIKDNAAAAAGPAAAADTKTLAARDAQDVSLRTQTELFKVVTPFLREFGSAQEADTQSATKFLEVQDATNDKTRAANAAKEVSKEVIDRATAARDKEITTATLENTTTVDTVHALTQGLIPGYQSEAEATARLANLQEPLIDIRQRQNQEIQRTSTTVVRTGQEQIAATTPLLARQEALAIASIKGAQAEHEQSLVNQANAQTFDAVTRATAAYNTAQQSGTEADKERTKAALDLAQAQERSALAQVRTADVAAQITEIGHTLQQNRDQAQVLALQAGLQGQTTEEITKQTAVLQTRQYISEHLNNVSDAYKKSVLDSVTGVQNLNIALAETQRQQERVSQLFQNFGETISSTLGTAIEDAFNGKKIQDWGAQLKQIIAQVLAQIVQFEFIRPAIGTALQSIGLQQAATNFGSIGAVTGATGVGAGAVGGTGILGTLGSAGNLVSAANGVSGGSVGGSIFGAGRFSGFLNNIGGSLGFAVPGAPFSATIAGPSVPGATTAATGAATGSLFGATSLSSLLGSAGVGFGAGIVANTLVGGNPIGGTVGSGLGALGGAALGNILLPGIGTVLGGILGGAAGGAGGGLLGNLFGNNQRPNAASGANINVGAGGVVSGFRTSGNQQNDQTVNQITSTISQFTNTLLTLTKGVESSTVNVQAGVRDGIKASIAGPSGTTNIQTKDPTEAINEIELNIAKGLTGVSDTLKTVLANVTDPAQIQSAVTFAATYDDLKTAADNAFSSISTDVKTVGPFAAALTSLNATFSSLTDQANQFGLSLDPINKGLAEATKRLRDDFGTALDQALNTANNSDFLNQLTTVAQGFSSNAQEQQAIGLGGDQGTTNKINQLEIAQAQTLLSALTTAQLNQVEDAFKTTNPEIAAMAKVLLDAGISADSVTSSLNDTTTALQNFATGVKSIEDALNQLHTGALAGLTPAGQVSAAQTAFQAQLATVQAAGPNVNGDQLSQLSNLGQTAVQTAQTVYGNAPQTTDLRNVVINSLNTVLSKTGPSTAVPATAAATNSAQAAIQASPTVASAQSAVVIAALHAAGVPGFAMGTMPVTMMPMTSMDYAKGDPTLGGSPSFKGTPSGTILVGEKGPEWMLPKGGDWTQVGKSGPELINQPGGAIILPNPLTPNSAFAEGIGAGDIAGQVPGIGSLISQAAGGPSLLSAVGGAAGIASETLSTIGGVLPIAGPLVGGLLGVATGHPVQGAIGAASSLIGFALGGPVGGVIGSLVGLLGNAFGPKPSNRASGDLIDLSSGEISGFQSAGDKNADTTVAQISAGISAIAKTFQAATGGTISGAINVQDGKRDGIKTSYSGPLGHIDAKWGSVQGAIEQFALAIAHNLTGISPELQAQLSGTNDPNTLIPIIETTTGASIDLNSGTVTFPATSAAAPAASAAAVAPVATAPPPPPTLQQMYDSVIAGDITSFNNDAGLQNKVNLVSLLTDYGRLTSDQKNTYVSTIMSDPTRWNNTPSGIVNKLSLVSATGSGVNADTTPTINNLMQQYGALPSYATGTPGAATLTQMYDSVIAANQADFNKRDPHHNDFTPETMKNKVNLVSLLTAYGELNHDQKENYGKTIASDTARYNNTPAGIVNKLHLISSVGFAASSTTDKKGVISSHYGKSTTTYASVDNTPTLDNLMNQYNKLSSLPNYAVGTHGRMGTPPGKILVGEKGPEWMHMRDKAHPGSNVLSMETYRQTLPNMAGWMLVGKHGPEVIDQAGGATILPFPKTPWAAAGRAFADGTGMPLMLSGVQGAYAEGVTPLPEMTFSTPAEPTTSHGQNEMHEANVALIKKLGDLQSEMVALRRVTQGGQEDMSVTAKASNRHLGEINKKTAPAIVSPRRQRLG